MPPIAPTGQFHVGKADSGTDGPAHRTALSLTDPNFRDTVAVSATPLPPVRSMSATDARGLLPRVLAELKCEAEDAVPVVITCHRTPMAVLISAEQYDEYCALRAATSAETCGSGQRVPAYVAPATFSISPATVSRRTAGVTRERPPSTP
jgi:hypothetical protein